MRTGARNIRGPHDLVTSWVLREGDEKIWSVLREGGHARHCASFVSVIPIQPHKGALK